MRVMPLCPDISIAVLSSSGIENRSKTKNQIGFKKTKKPARIDLVGLSKTNRQNFKKSKI
jgi:hypothetical protein